MREMIPHFIDLDQAFGRFDQLAGAHYGIAQPDDILSGENVSVGSFARGSLLWTFASIREPDRQQVLVTEADRTNVVNDDDQGSMGMQIALVENNEGNFSISPILDFRARFIPASHIVPEVTPLAYGLYRRLAMIGEAGSDPRSTADHDVTLANITQQDRGLGELLTRAMSVEFRDRYVTCFATEAQVLEGKRGALALRGLADDLYHNAQSDLAPGVSLIKDPYTRAHRRGSHVMRSVVQPPSLALVETTKPMAMDYQLILFEDDAIRVVMISGNQPVVSELSIPPDGASLRTATEPRHLQMAHLSGQSRILNNRQSERYVQLLTDIQAGRAD